MVKNRLSATLPLPLSSFLNDDHFLLLGLCVALGGAWGFPEGLLHLVLVRGPLFGGSFHYAALFMTANGRQRYCDTAILDITVLDITALESEMWYC